MKNETTFQIERQNLQKLFSDRQFEDAETLATRMLDDYNRFDYELLLKRARIRQCLMKYEEAIYDANLALNVLPNKPEAYTQLSDCFIACQKLPDAAKMLRQLKKLNPSNSEQIDQ